jgi:uncharacterized protein (DUF4415 family)
MPKLKPGHISPTDEEEAVINAGIAADPDAYELSDEEFAKLQPIAEVKNRRGRPPLDAPKVAIKLRLDREVVEGFRATGPGWQSRINAALRNAMGLGGSR